MCLETEITTYLATIGKTNAPMIQYSIRWDGLEIRPIALPLLLQTQRDEIRGMIAREYSVARHQLKISRKFADGYVWPDEKIGLPVS